MNDLASHLDLAELLRRAVKYLVEGIDSKGKMVFLSPLTKNESDEEREIMIFKPKVN